MTWTGEYLDGWFNGFLAGGGTAAVIIFTFLGLQAWDYCRRRWP